MFLTLEFDFFDKALDFDLIDEKKGF